MRLSLTTEDGNIINIELNPEVSCEEFKILCETETGISKDDFQILSDGKIIDLSQFKDLQEAGFKDDDLLFITKKLKNIPTKDVSKYFNIDFSNIQLPGPSTSSTSNRVRTNTSFTNPKIDGALLAQLKTHFIHHPREFESFKQRNPALYQALMNNDVAQFGTLMKQVLQEYSSTNDNLRMMSNDQLNPKVQEQIANLIHQNNINANMETALEHTPESFGIVTMLYINIKVNGHPVKAFVDTGAQATLMSKSCAERCNLLRLADKRWAGIAKGVGTQSILGRIHLTQVAIGNVFIACSFSILEDQPMDILIGLDILRRHQCTIDLKENLLHITSHGVSTPFLAESELPECARHNFTEPTKKADSGDLNGPTPTPKTVSDEAVQALVEMGFSRDLATEELIKCNGNVNVAASNLSKFL